MRSGGRPLNSNPCRLFRAPKARAGIAICLRLSLRRSSGREHRRTEAPSFIALMRLLLLTGARKGEWVAARWEWINSDRGHLRIPAQAHKTGRRTGPKTVALPPAALEVLDGLERNGAFCSTREGAKREGPFTGGGGAYRRKKPRATVGPTEEKCYGLLLGRLKTTAILLTICGSVLSGSVVERVSRVSTPANNGAPDRLGRLPRSRSASHARQCRRSRWPVIAFDRRPARTPKPTPLCQPH